MDRSPPAARLTSGAGGGVGPTTTSFWCGHHQSGKRACFAASASSATPSRAFSAIPKPSRRHLARRSAGARAAGGRDQAAIKNRRFVTHSSVPAKARSERGVSRQHPEPTAHISRQRALWRRRPEASKQQPCRPDRPLPPRSGNATPARRPRRSASRSGSARLPPPAAPGRSCCRPPAAPAARRSAWREEPLC